MATERSGSGGQRHLRWIVRLGVGESPPGKAGTLVQVQSDRGELLLVSNRLAKS